MTDDIDKTTETIAQTTRTTNHPYCPRCGMYMNGFTECPWCSKHKGLVREEVKAKPKPRRWMGGVEIK